MEGMQYIKDVCKMGQGEDCCRYLCMTSEGWLCGKLDIETKLQIDLTVVQMSAKADNCEGKELEK